MYWVRLHQTLETLLRDKDKMMDGWLKTELNLTISSLVDKWGFQGCPIHTQS